MLHEGCVELNETPAKERNDPQNNNYVCNDFCDGEGKKYSATMGARCMCFSSRLTNGLPKDKCDTACPKNHPGDAGNGSSGCEGFGCCGSVTNNAVTLIQTVKLSRDKSLMKNGKAGTRLSKGTQ